jgi:NAD(P)-dependent dehydrogenase (short-subunit alcohol dehydrogenase family)
MGTLDGRGIVVTGGAGDIGNAIAHRLHADGAVVTVFDLAAPEDVADRLAPEMSYAQVDVRDRDAVDQALAAIDRLDVVFSNAGTVRSAPFLEVTAEDWDAHLAINLTGSFNLTQAAARLMAERGQPGHIVLTGSWVQDVPWPEISAYSVSKAGLKMLAKSAARELAPHRIRVNVLAPGIVDAGLARMQLETDPAYAARAGVVIPLEELQTPAQVADAARFLASDEAAYMTGAVLLVDGGCSLFRFDG